MNDDIIAAVQSIAGVEGTVLPAGLDALAVDGRPPRAAVRPGSIEEISRLLALANERLWAVAPRGGGTKLNLGHSPRRLDLALDLGRLAAGLEHEPADLTVTVEAGMTVANLQSYLARHGQHLPLDPPLPERATVGGVLAANAYGPFRLAHGTGRDLVLGLRVVNAGGQVTRSGGRVVKNVAGYDLNKLYIGSLGTLGVIVEATFKVAPRPAAEASVVGVFADREGAAAASRRLVREGLLPAALGMADAQAAAGWPGIEVRRAGDYGLAAAFLGPAATVDRLLGWAQTLLREGGAGQVRSQEGEAHRHLWQAIRHFGRPPEPGRVLARVTVRPAQADAVMAASTALPETGDLGRGILFYAGSGVIFLRLACEAGQEERCAAAVAGLRAAAASQGGRLVIESAPLPFKEQVDVWGPLGPELDLMRAIKGQFDPRGVLNPGRFVGGI